MPRQALPQVQKTGTSVTREHLVGAFMRVAVRFKQGYRLSQNADNR